MTLGLGVRPEASLEHAFDRENLDVYKLALEVARACPALKIAVGRAHLRDQLQRAAGSVVLNIAEGRARGGDAGRDHHRIAAGSAAESCAALDLVGTAEAADMAGHDGGISLERGERGSGGRVAVGGRGLVPGCPPRR